MSGSGLPMKFAACLLVLWLWSRLWQLAMNMGKRRMLGLKNNAPNWKVYAHVFPVFFPKVVGWIWGTIGAVVPCELMIWLHGYFNGAWSRKAVWTFRTHVGAQGMVALTIDDAPARPGGTPMTKEVLEVLDEYNATCSFFVVTTFMEGREEMMREMVARGHELCNHAGRDIAYHRHSKEAFHEVFLECEAKINTCLREVNEASPAPKDVNRSNNKWFRPPWAKVSDAMVEVLEEQGVRVVMSDCYGMDVMCRPPFIGNYTASHARSGSIVLLHMPEVGFREYNLESLRMALAGLQARGLQCISLSQMEAVCKASMPIHACSSPKSD